MQYKYPQIDLKKTGENIKRLRKLKNLSVGNINYFSNIIWGKNWRDISYYKHLNILWGVFIKLCKSL